MYTKSPDKNEVFIQRFLANFQNVFTSGGHMQNLDFSLWAIEYLGHFMSLNPTRTWLTCSVGQLIGL